MYCDAFHGKRLGFPVYFPPWNLPIRLRPVQSTSNAPTAPTALTAPLTIWSWGFAASSGAVHGTAGAGSGVVSAGIGTLVGAREGAHVGACKGRSIMRARALEHTRKGGRRRQGYRDRRWERGGAVSGSGGAMGSLANGRYCCADGTDSPSLFQFIPASGGTRTTRPCSRSLRPRAHPHRRTLLWHPHRSRIPRARSCLRKWWSCARVREVKVPPRQVFVPCDLVVKVSK